MRISDWSSDVCSSDLLGILFENECDGIAWLRGPHNARVFGGQPPIDLVTAGTQDALMTVRRFLDAARGGLYMPPTPEEANFAPYEDSEITFPLPANSRQHPPRAIGPFPPPFPPFV